MFLLLKTKANCVIVLQLCPDYYEEQYNLIEARLRRKPEENDMERRVEVRLQQEREKEFLQHLDVDIFLWGSSPRLTSFAKVLGRLVDYREEDQCLREVDLV